MKQVKGIHAIHKAPPFDKCNIPDVFLHGDFWGNNLMFARDADGNASDDLVANTDWQVR